MHLYRIVAALRRSDNRSGGDRRAGRPGRRQPQVNIARPRQRLGHGLWVHCRDDQVVWLLPAAPFAEEAHALLGAPRQKSPGDLARSPSPAGPPTANSYLLHLAELRCHWAGDDVSALAMLLRLRPGPGSVTSAIAQLEDRARDFVKDRKRMRRFVGGIWVAIRILRMPEPPTSC